MLLRRATIALAALCALAMQACHPRPAAPWPPPGASYQRHDGEPVRDMFGRPFARQRPLVEVQEESEPFAAEPAPLIGAPNFLFVLGQGSSLHGFDVLKIDASGQVEAIYGAATGFKTWRAVFRLSEEEILELEKELVAIEAFTLKRGYHSDAQDGTQWFVRVRAGNRRKWVGLDNHFPAAVVRLSAFVHERIVKPHKADFDAAELLPSHRENKELVRWEDAPPAER